MKPIYFLFIAFLFIQCSNNSDSKVKLGDTKNGKTVSKVEITESLPYFFAPFIMNELKDEVKYDEIIESFLNYEFKDLSSKKLIDKFNYNPTINSIHAQTEKYAPGHYDIILKGDCDCFTSPPFIFKKLPNLGEREVYLFGQIIENKIYQNKRGFTFELVTLKNSEIIERHRVIIAGFGKEDSRFQEAFIINKDYSIDIKGYNKIEGEFSTLKRRIILDKSGKFKELKPNLHVEHSY